MALDHRSSAGIGPWARPPARPGWTNGPRSVHQVRKTHLRETIPPHTTGRSGEAAISHGVTTGDPPPEFFAYYTHTYSCYSYAVTLSGSPNTGPATCIINTRSLISIQNESSNDRF